MSGMMEILLLLALASGGEGAESRAPAAVPGLDPEREALQDLALRIPSIREDQASPVQEGEKQDPPVVPSEARQADAPVVDFSWLELYPRLGMAMFSSKYHVKPSVCFGIAARAPMPWLSPSSNTNGEYFGLFAELDLAMIKRDIFPKLQKEGGPIFMLGFGVDYTFYRNESWLLMVEAGAHYVNFGGITDLTNGLTPMFGVVAGVTLSRGLSLSLSPEIEYPKTGDYIMMMTIGLVWEF